MKREKEDEESRSWFEWRDRQAVLVNLPTSIFFSSAPQKMEGEHEKIGFSSSETPDQKKRPSVRAYQRYYNETNDPSSSSPTQKTLL